MENVRSEPDQIFCFASYVFHRLYYREFLSPSRRNPVPVSQSLLLKKFFVVKYIIMQGACNMFISVLFSAQDMLSYINHATL